MFFPFDLSYKIINRIPITNIHPTLQYRQLKSANNKTGFLTVRTRILIMTA
jgi:hypothetical protein